MKPRNAAHRKGHAAERQDYATDDIGGPLFISASSALAKLASRKPSRPRKTRLFPADANPVRRKRPYHGGAAALLAAIRGAA